MNEKLKSNTHEKIKNKIALYSSHTGEEYIGIIGNDSEFLSYTNIYKFLDKDNNLIFIPGYKFNNKEIIKKTIILNYNKYSDVSKRQFFETNYNYDFSELDDKDFKNIDHNISPICPEHGEFITTPRKLLENDKCKWCDGIENIDGVSYYNLNRCHKLNEKLLCLNLYPNLKVIKYENPYIIHIQKTEDGKIKNDCVDYNFFKKLFNEIDIQLNSNYLEYLKSIRENTFKKTIFHKINIIDKSTKFQFGLVNFLPTEFKDLDEDSDNIEKILLKHYNKVLKYFNIEIVFYSLESSIRAYFKTLQYQEQNKEKHILLPKEIINKFPKENYSGVITFSENSWESTSTSVRLLRESLLYKTNICPICKKEIVNPVVDHQHKKKVKGTGRIRDNICANCNVFIAKTENNCTRFKISQEELPEVLKNISTYFGSQQYNIIHYTDKDPREKISKTEVNKILKYWPLLYPNRKLPSRPKSGVLTKDFKEYQEKLKEYLKNPYPVFPKKLWTQLKIKMESQGWVIPDYPKIHKVITPDWDKLLRRYNVI